MPRRYYRRRYGGYRKRRKWSPTLVNGSFSLSATASTSNFQGTVLCRNSSNVGTDVPVSTIVKVKNFKVLCDITSVSNSISNLFVGIIFVPQGFTVSLTTPTEHPEWLLVWRTIDGTAGASLGVQNVQISSRLARNLNSGDSIVLFTSGTNLQSSTATMNFSFYCSFVTCNN